MFSCSSFFKLHGNRQNFLFQKSALQTSGFAFALSKALGILSSLFSPLKAWQTSKLAFAFSLFHDFHDEF
jgi:hypothetical protein